MPILPYLDRQPRLADDVFLAPTAFVVGDVTIGPRCSLWFGATVRGDTGPVVLGEAVNVQEAATVHTQDGRVTRVGDRVTMGHHALVHGAVVEDDVIVGSNASILTGARVGHGSIVAAHSVVAEGKEIPPGSLVMGVPGKVLRPVTEAERERIRRNAEAYERLGQEYRRSLPGLS